MVEDGDFLAYEAVCDSSSAVYVCALHYDGVLYLGVSDGGVVSDARVGADIAVVSDDSGVINGCPAVDRRYFIFSRLISAQLSLSF